MTTPPNDLASALSGRCRVLSARVRRLSDASELAGEAAEAAHRALLHLDLSIEALGRVTIGASTGRAGRLGGGIARALGRLAGRIGSLSGARGPSRSEWGEAAHLGGIGGAGGSLESDGTAFTIADCLSFLQAGGKTGRLDVHLPGERITIRVEHGSLVDAYSDNAPPGCRLGELLTAMGAIERATLDAFLVYHSRDNGRLGQALELNQLVSSADLREALKQQIVRAFQRLHQAGSTPFRFQACAPMGAGSDLNLGMLQLLLESACRNDEADRSEGTASEREPGAGEPSANEPAPRVECEPPGLFDRRSEPARAQPDLSEHRVA